MRIISQNVTNFGIEVPKDTIFRINLAWCSSVKQLRDILDAHKNNELIDVFKKYTQQLIDYCNSNKIILLRTIGVMFSDEEKRISEYIK